MNENQVNGWPDRQKTFGGEWIKSASCREDLRGRMDEKCRFIGNNFGGE
jgi:hypothetical protein